MAPTLFEIEAAVRWDAELIRLDGHPCPCHGSGWLLSDWDVWVSCTCGATGPHPEDYDLEEVP